MKKLFFILMLCIPYIYIFPAPKMNITLDAASFKTDNGKVRWEFYYVVPDTAMKYVFNDMKLRGSIIFAIEISSSINLIEQRTWEVKNSKEEGEVFHNINLYGQQNFILNEGEYKIKIVASDKNDPLNMIETSFTFITNKYANKDFAISDIEVSQMFIKPDSNSKNDSEFIKGDIAIIPNPSAEIVNKSLKIYYEIYKPPANQKIEVSYELYNSIKNRIFRIPRYLSSSKSIITDFIEIPFEVVPTGVYYFKLRAVDLKRPFDTLESTKKLYVLNVNIPPERDELFSQNKEFESSEFATMDANQIDKELLYTKEIMRKNIKQEFEALKTTKAKQRALYKYWTERDPDTTTAINEARLDFRKRVEFANQYFSSGQTEGWMTDRGKTLLKYGFWDYRDIYPKKDFKNAAEVWYYPNVQGGSYFYFVDVYTNLSFKLVHSSATGEEYNPNWINEYNPAIENEEVLRKFKTSDNSRPDLKLR